MKFHIREAEPVDSLTELSDPIARIESDMGQIRVAPIGLNKRLREPIEIKFKIREPSARSFARSFNGNVINGNVRGRIEWR